MGVVIEWGRQQFLPFCAVMLPLTLLELVFPRGRRSLQGRLRGLAYWQIWLVASMVSISLFSGGWHYLGVKPLVVPLSGLIARTGFFAPILATIIAAFVADFFFYWFHRAQHAYFWRYHAVHHSIEDLSAINSYHHISEPLFSLLLVAAPAGFLLVDAGPMLPWAAVLIHGQGVYLHSPTRLTLGPLRYIFADNRYHRIHHGRDPRYHSRNFAAATPLWDVVFGTVRWPQKDEWPAVGLVEAPEPTTVREWLDMPFRYRARSARPYSAIG